MTQNKNIANWLFICAAAVFLMALIGAVTRLTESGLSIVEWKPVTGALPPLNSADWQAEFDLYRHSPQFEKINHGMDLSDFKKIYFWEWLHRFWGRMIGLIYALPLIFFWRRIPKEKHPAALGILGLGFLQGAMGWYMVKSGLIDQPAVSHYRLAAHLMLAVLIYGCLLRFGLYFCFAREAGAAKLVPLRGLIRATLGAAFLTMTWGALTAGLDAGLLYNTFPTMDGHWLPPEIFTAQPVWKSFIAEPAVVQFTHRLLAFVTLLKIIVLFAKSRRVEAPARARRLFNAVLIMALLQATLGISTLLSGVNMILATLHQAGALVLIALLIWLLFEIPEKKNV